MLRSEKRNKIIADILEKYSISIFKGEQRFTWVSTDSERKVAYWFIYAKSITIQINKKDLPKFRDIANELEVALDIRPVITWLED